MDDDPKFRAYARDLILAPGSQTDALGLRRAMKRYFVHGKSGDPSPLPLSIYRNLAWRLLLLELWSATYLS